MRPLRLARTTWSRAGWTTRRGAPLGGADGSVQSAGHFYALSQVLEVVNPVPGKPEIQKVNAAVGATTASFYWINPAPNFGTEILFFRVERRKDDVDAWTLAGVGRAGFALFEDTGLDPETTYHSLPRCAR